MIDNERNEERKRGKGKGKEKQKERIFLKVNYVCERSKSKPVLRETRYVPQAY